MPWEDVAYAVKSVENPRITEFLTALRTIYVNGAFPSILPSHALQDTRVLPHGPCRCPSLQHTAFARTDTEVSSDVPSARWLKPTHMLPVDRAYERRSASFAVSAGAM